MNRNDKPRDSIQQRITDLREDRGWSQKELAHKLNVTPSQICRMENGSAKNINDEMLIALARTFEVSADYLLGLTPVSKARNYDIAKLGLTEEAARKMMSGTVDMDVLNRLIEHKNFGFMTYMIRSYLMQPADRALNPHHIIMEKAAEALREKMKNDPENRAELMENVREIQAQKRLGADMEREKVQEYFKEILRDMEQKYPEKEDKRAKATAEMVERIWAEGMANRETDKRKFLSTMIKIVSESVSEVCAAHGLRKRELGIFTRLFAREVGMLPDRNQKSKSKDI